MQKIRGSFKKKKKKKKKKQSEQQLAEDTAPQNPSILPKGSVELLKDTKKKDIPPTDIHSQESSWSGKSNIESTKPSTLDSTIPSGSIPFTTFAATATLPTPTPATLSLDTTKTLRQPISADSPEASIFPHTNLTAAPSQSSSDHTSPVKRTAVSTSSDQAPSTTNMSTSSDQVHNKGSFADLLYDQLSNLFSPSDSQVLAMEFPGRVLDEGTYLYDQENPLYANVTKPQVVKEEEFRLADSLYKVDISKEGGHIVGGPSGEKLSLMYEEVLSTLVPKMDDFGRLYRDRKTLRDWLLEEVTDTIDEEKFVGSRIALYSKLTERYEEAKREWEEMREQKLLEAKQSGSTEKLDEYLKWLAYDGPSKEAEIDTFYNDLIVRGYYHEIRRVLAYIDVSSPAELLEECKMRMLNSGALSMDESETIYPVQMQPVSWAKSLSTDFEPVNLLLDPENIQMQLMQKFEERDDLLRDLAHLKGRPTGDVDKLQREVDDAQKAVDDANGAMIKQFGETALTVAKIAYNYYTNKQGNKGKSEKELIKGLGKDDLAQNDGKPLLDDKDFEKFKEFQNKAIDNQNKLTEAGRNLAHTLAMKAQAEATVTRDQVISLDSKLTTLNREIEHLKTIALSGTKGSDPRKGVEDLHPAKKADSFMDVIIHSEKHDEEFESKLHADSKSSSTNVSFFFGSYGSSSSSAHSTFSEKFNSKTVKFDVGFRAMKVTIDRGGWFDPEIFEASNAFYRTGSGLFTDKFNTYPTAFIVAKDMTIHFHLDEDQRDDFSQYAEKSSSSGGGFLCFGTNSSSHEKDSTKKTNVGKTDTGVMIRIPGAQILMWVLQEVPQDKSDPYPKDKSALGDFTLATHEE